MNNIDSLRIDVGLVNVKLVAWLKGKGLWEEAKKDLHISDEEY